ncbi:MAG: hypothetical protein DMG39_24490 [Acidobacteria bacterium]|nr:MAG: hypothetical protein DMG39_24490 [Acidobacteriota bacterium]
MKIYRHGDVLFEQVESIPEMHNPRTTDEEKKGVVQLGETIGHAHVIEDMTGVEIFSDRRDRFLKAEQAFTISHQEHKALTLPAGNYRIRIAREFDYIRHAARMVAD